MPPGDGTPFVAIATSLNASSTETDDASTAVCISNAAALALRFSVGGGMVVLGGQAVPRACASQRLCGLAECSQTDTPVTTLLKRIASATPVDSRFDTELPAQ